MIQNVITPMFRVSYPQVFRPRRNDLNGKDEYSVVALFPKGADLAVLTKAANDAIVEKWGADKAKWPKPLRSPFRKHDEKEKEGKLPEGMEVGGIFISLRSIQRPGLVDGNRQPILDETGFYAGCFARAQVRAYAYDQKGKRASPSACKTCRRWPTVIRCRAGRRPRTLSSQWSARRPGRMPAIRSVGNLA